MLLLIAAVLAWIIGSVVFQPRSAHIHVRNTTGQAIARGIVATDWGDTLRVVRIEPQNERDIVLE